MEPSTSSRGDDRAKPMVFLSHSGLQKAFVELLNDALKRAQHTTFFDKETLGMGCHFPSDIHTAADGCKLGVLVLSHDYMYSKWPMLEFGWLVSKDILLIPLFYKITIQELRCTENLSKWKQEWIKMVGLEQAERWEKAVKKLPSTNGVVHQQNQGELAYIDEVVKAICKLIASNVAYDLSYVKGHHQLSMEIKKYFDAPVADRRHCGKARMVGLHGVAGLGKTTLCKSMVNLFTSRYLGRSCLIQFPTNYDEHEVVKACKQALEKLANLQSYILGVESFDMVVELMRKHVSELNVFVAIDNVWEDSVEAAQRLLGIGFTADSKILLTSRSKGVLKELLSRDASKSYNCYIGPLPAPMLTDAFQIFQASVSRGDLTSLPFRDEIDNLLNRCRYEGKYHPLALKALGTYVRRSCGAGDSEMDANGWSRVLGGIRDINLKTVEDAINFNYQYLDPHLKHMFLDIALWIPFPCRDIFERSHANARRSLCFFYDEETLIDRAIYDLDMAGVIHIEKDKHGQEMIEVHDLYLDLAKKEAANSSRFLIKTSKNSVKGINWGNLKRVSLEPYTKMVQLHRCQQIQFLYANGIKPEHRIPVMPILSLRVAILKWAQKEEDPCTLSQINFNGFMHLRFLCLEDCNVESLEGLKSLLNLQILAIFTCFRLKDIAALSCLTQLVILSIRNCHALKGIPDLGEATGLERLHLCGNESLEKVEGRLGPALKLVNVSGCTVLKGIPDLGEATGLRWLVLEGNESLETVEGRLGPALKEVGVAQCTALKGILDLGEATVLESLVLIGNESLEKVKGRLGPALKVVGVGGCTALKGIPDLGEATGLEDLVLVGNESLEKVEGRLGPALKTVHVRGCTVLKGILDLGEATGLERLLLEGESLETVEGHLGPALKEVGVFQCTALKGILDLGEATGLEALVLIGNESLEKVEGRLGPALKTVAVTGCTVLKGIPDLGEATGLESLELCGNESLEKVEGHLGPALKTVTVRGCTVLKGIPDLGEATGLERLLLEGNESLETVEGCLGPALKEVVVENCTALKRFADLSGATGLLDMSRVRLNN